MSMKIFIVYLITNLVNGKYYVGWTNKSLKERWRDHCRSAAHGAPWYLSRAIRFHNSDAFCIEMITIVYTKKEAKEYEKLWIAALNAYNSEFGYNMTHGGDGCCWELIPKERQKEIIAKRTISLRKRAQNPTEAMLLRAQKISKILKGRPNPNKGKSLGEICGEHKAFLIRKNLSDYHRKQKSSGIKKTSGTKRRKELLPRYFSEEHRKSLSIAATKRNARDRSLGKPSILQGRIRITNEITNKLLPKGETNIPEGWRKGQTRKGRNFL